MDSEATTVSILDRKYKLKSNSEKAAELQKAAAMVDAVARKYGRMYAYHDYQDLLAMVALTQMERLLNIDNLLTGQIG
ncbi:MAG: hypothetical protein AUK63_1503 [bacterium P3]|nr:MAG: hypothetical protein AUK63_1503 [bacterium P3]KWW41101.1 MAG: hypothetical protein F083_1268 [bacterium F083]